MEKIRKFILDACCGGRMFWINKKHPNAIYIDNRLEEKGHITRKSNHSIQPDIVMDFRDLKFEDKTFKLVVWDPPPSIMAKQYGILNKETWPYDLKQGFKECWRVLDDYGILIFKWNEKQIKTREVLNLFPVKPLFGHPDGNRQTTFWLCFMKIPEVKSDNS
jgi:hypothetical protein